MFTTSWKVYSLFSLIYKRRNKNWIDHRVSHEVTWPIVSGKTEPRSDSGLAVFSPQQTFPQLPMPRILQVSIKFPLHWEFFPDHTGPESSFVLLDSIALHAKTYLVLDMQRQRVSSLFWDFSSDGVAHFIWRWSVCKIKTQILFLERPFTRQKLCPWESLWDLPSNLRLPQAPEDTVPATVELSHTKTQVWLSPLSVSLGWSLKDVRLSMLLSPSRPVEAPTSAMLLEGNTSIEGK